MDGRIETFLDEWRERENVPGASVATFDPESGREATGVGVRDRESGAGAAPETLYAVGSVAKPFTATAVLQLVDDGTLALDEPVAEYVPAVADVPGDPITVRGLLSHSAGLPRDFVASRGRRGDDRDVLAYVAEASSQRLTDRRRYMYSNSGYFVLAELLEAVDGRPYAEYVERELFDPLGMERSTFDPEALETDGDAMTGYRETEHGLEPGTMEPGAGASGGLIAPVTELIPLLRCVADGGVYDGTRVLSAELVDEMRRLQSPPLPTADGAERGYGYGWEVSEFLGETLVAHRGAIGVSGGYVGVLPERGVGVAMAYNRLGRGPIRTGKGVLSILAGESPAETVRLVAVDDAVEAVCGRYTSYQDAMTVDVERAPAGTIRVSLPDRGTSFTATPEEVSADACTFAATMGGGVKWLAEFDRGSSDVELILSMGKWTARLSDG